MSNGRESNSLPSVRSFAQTMNAQLMEKRDHLESALPAHISVDRFIDVARTAIVQNGKDLRKCDPDSVYMAFRRCAQAGLLPDGDESAIVRYGSEAQWMPMVKGVVRQILRSPNVEKVETRVVRKGDDFEIGYGLHPRLDHRPTGQPPSEEPLDPTVTGAYAIVFWEGKAAERATFEYVTREEIEKARDTSRASNSGAWTDWYPEMARKTALHRVAKYVDLAPEAQRIIQQDVAASWEDAAPPAREGADMEDRLAESVSRDVEDVKKRTRRLSDGAATGAEKDEDAAPEQEQEPEDAEPEPETETEPADAEGEPEAAAGERIYPDDERAPDNLPRGVGLWIETPGSGWYRPFVVERAPGGIIEQAPPEDAFLIEKNVRMSEAVRIALAWASGDDEAIEQDGADAAGAEDAAPEEPSPEEAAEAERVKAEQLRKMIRLLIEDEDGDVNRRMVVDATEKLFGGSDAVERTDAGFVDVGALSRERLRRLVDELLEQSGEEVPDVT